MKLRLPLLFLWVFASGLSGLAQTHDFFIGFTDRNGNPYSIQQPLDFLSQRALDRRTRQNIPLTDSDLPVNPNYVSGVAALGIQVVHEVKWFNGITVRCDSSQLPAILALPYVRQSQPIKRLHGPSGRIRKFDRMPDGIPVMTPEMRTLTLDYGSALRQIQQLNATFLHDQSYAGQGMLIGVLDAGFNALDTISAFQPLLNRSGLIGTWDFVEDESSVYENDAHGTEVMSCMAADAPGQMIGTAPEANYLLLRTEDALTEYPVEEYNWAVGAAYADSAGVDVINSSLGYSEFDDPAYNYTYADLDGNTTPSARAADVAASKGILVLLSAGNQGSSSWHYISTPADADSALTVGAVDSAGYQASFSSWGPSADGRVKPDVMAMGRRTAVVYCDGSYTRGSGTSFSSPVLAGAAACLWQAHPAKTNMEILRAIQESASYYTSPSDSLGYGIPDFYAAHVRLGVEAPGAQSSEGILYVSPNPFSDRFTLGYFSGSSQAIQCDLVDVTGRLFQRQSMAVRAGEINRLEFQTEGFLPAGIYQLVVTGKDSRSTRTLTVVR